MRPALYRFGHSAQSTRQSVVLKEAQEEEEGEEEEEEQQQQQREIGVDTHQRDPLKFQVPLHHIFTYVALNLSTSEWFRFLSQWKISIETLRLPHFPVLI